MKKLLSMFLVIAMLVSVCAMALASSDFILEEEADIQAATDDVDNRPQVRWWLDQGYHTDETIREEIQNLYDLGYGGVELLCLNDDSVDNSLYGWGSEEWYNDVLIVVEECGKLGMTVSFAAGPDWQPTMLYYGTNEDVAENDSWEDYYEDYAILRENGLDVLTAAYEDGSYNIYETEDGTLTIDPNVDVFNQGLVADEAVYVAAGETVTIDVTGYYYEAPVNTFGGGGGEGGGPEGEGAPGASVSDDDVTAAVEAEEEVELMGTSVDRVNSDVTFANLQAITIAEVVETEATYERSTIGVYSSNSSEVTGTVLSVDSVTQFTTEELSVGGLVSYDEATETYTFTWTNTYDFEVCLVPMWKVGVGHGTEADTYDYGYMIMVNHFTTAGADAWFAFLKSYLLTDEMMALIEEYDITWDLFIDSLEIGSLGRFYWSDEMTEIFYELNGYDVTPYLAAMYDTSYYIEGIDEVENDMRDAMTEAYIIFQERLSENLATAGGELRAQVSYGSVLTTSSAIRAVDVPETESLAFKFSVESFKLMSGGVHLSGAEEFSSETNNWLKVTIASYNDQLYVVYQQMAAGVNRTVWHGFETTYSSEATLDWPNNNGGIGCMFGSINLPGSVLEADYSEHITRLQGILKMGTETADIGIMQNDLFVIALSADGDDKGLLTDEHSLQNEGYIWECFDSSYLWADDGEYGFLNEDGTLGYPQYKAIIVWDEDLTLTAAEALLGLVEDGLYVIFYTDAAATTTGSEAGSDEDLAAVVAEIKSYTDNVTTVAETEDFVTALAEFGITPRVAFEQGVFEEYNLDIYEESLEAGEAYYSYDGLWTAMMSDEDANYYFIFNESVDYTMETTVSFEGLFTPYELDTWSGEVSAIAEYAYVDGRTEFVITLEPAEAAVYIMQKDVADDSVYVISTDADATEIAEDGSIIVLASEDGSYTTELSDGTSVTSDIVAPAIEWDGVWTVEIEQWTEGDIVSIEETRDNIDPYTSELFTYEGSTSHTTIEYAYETSKEIVFSGEVANDALVAWKDFYSTGLSEEDLTTVSGVGYYTTTFTATEDGERLVIDLGDIDGMVGLSVNGEKFDVDITNCIVDISSAVVAGENTVKVTVTTTITNYTTDGEEKTARGMEESAPYYPIVYKELPCSYGITEAVVITAYGEAVVAE